MGFFLDKAQKSLNFHIIIIANHIEKKDMDFIVLKYSN